MSTSDTLFDGLWIPLVTPLRDGRVDLPALETLTDVYRQAGVAGLVLFGTTGEGNLLSLPEKFDACAAVRGVAPTLPLMLGVGGIDTRSVCQSVRKLDRLQPVGWLVPPPYYLRPSAEGVAWHYAQVSLASERPIVIYDVPKRTGVTMTLSLLERLCADTRCVAVKECETGMLEALGERGDLKTLCGEDAAFLDHVERGGAGAISASAHVRPDIFLAVIALVRAGRRADARALFATIAPVIRLLFEEPNPAPIKHVLARQGLLADELRLPMTPASERLGRRLAQAIDRLPSASTVARMVERRYLERLDAPPLSGRPILHARATTRSVAER